MATVADVISTYEQYWGYVPGRFYNMDPNSYIDDSYISWIKDNIPDSGTSGGTSGGTGGDTGTTGGGGSEQPSGSSSGTTYTLDDVLALFAEYGLDPYVHFDGSERTQEELEQIVADLNSGARTWEELNDTLANAPGASTGGGAQTGNWTLAMVIAIFDEYGLDPYTNFDGTPRDPQDVVDKLNNGTYTEESLREILQNWVDNPYDVGPPLPNAGAAGTPGVWSGGQLYLIARPGQEDKWVMVYEWNGRLVAWEFASEEQMRAQIGGPEAVGGFMTKSEEWYNSNVTFAGDTVEITGSGSFEGWMNDMISEVTSEAGIGDPTLWGEYVNDPEIQDIIFQAAVEEWGDAQITAAIRQTDFYQNVLYPGIVNFFNSDNPEAAWYQYFNNVRPMLEALGVDPGDDRWRSVVGDMINAGVSDQLFNNMAGVFMRAATSEEYAAVLDQWFQSELGRSLDFDTWYDVLAGQTEADVRDVVNKAVVAYQSEVTSAGLTDDQIRKVAEGRPALTDAEVAGFLGQYMASVHSVEGILGRYGITKDEILSASAGIGSDSGRSLEEIQRLTRQAAGEAGRLDDEKVQFFLDFTPQGTPRRTGLSALAPEGG